MAIRVQTSLAQKNWLNYDNGLPSHYAWSFQSRTRKREMMS